MGLENLKKELEEQIEEAKRREAGEEEKVVEEPAEEIAEEPAEPEKQDEKAPEQEEKLKEPEKTEELDASGYARLRREARAAEKRAEDLQKQLDSLAQKKDPDVETSEPVYELPPVVQDIVTEYHMSRAEREFQAYEEQARRANPDYDEVGRAYAQSVFTSLRTLNPDVPVDQIVKETKKTLLEAASNYLQKGYANPAEEMYHRAKEMGFRAQERKEEPEAKEEPRPNMKKVAENRSRSAGMAATSGESKAALTKAAAAVLSVSEWQKLPRAEKERILAIV